MSIFPLSVFLALRVIKLHWLGAGIGALLASQISTDGLYGLDPPSFLFRGWGLSSQLFSMIWLPLAIAYSWRYFSGQGTGDRRHEKHFGRSFFDMSHVSCCLFPATFFLVATTMGHLGIGFIAMLSLIPLALARPLDKPKENIPKLIFLGGITVFFLSYWIVPIFLANDYHNVSFWDPVWKFDSFGWRLTMDRLVNGELFDWGRLPVMTMLVFVGIFVGIVSEHFVFALLFIFWLLLYFGRTTWGGLIDLIPGMSEFHISRFIVGLHLAGLFLAPIGINAIVSACQHISVSKKHHSLIPLFAYSIISLFIYFALYPQTVRYAAHNDFLIRQANEMYKKVEPDLNILLPTLKELPPGRIYAGRGGNWGKEFKVADTTMFMHLSTYGLPLTLWLPETWSPNSDIEQYFSDTIVSHYALFGIGYVVTPRSVDPLRFWKFVKETPSWKLYEIEDVSYITGGVRPAIVSSSKLNYTNVVRLWIQSDLHEKGLYPQITFAKDFPRKTGLPNFRMLDEVTYKVPDLPAEALAKAGGSTHNLFAEPPVYMSDSKPDIKILSESQESDMIFKTNVEVGDNCNECIVILKQSSHPNWRVTVDNKPVEHLTVFPFFVAVPVSSGTHEVIFSYQPSGLKVILIAVELVAIASFLVIVIRSHVSPSSC